MIFSPTLPLIFCRLSHELNIKTGWRAAEVVMRLPSLLDRDGEKHRAVDHLLMTSTDPWGRSRLADGSGYGLVPVNRFGYRCHKECVCGDDSLSSRLIRVVEVSPVQPSSRRDRLTG